MLSLRKLHVVSSAECLATDRMGVHNLACLLICFEPTSMSGYPSGYDNGSEVCCTRYVSGRHGLHAIG